MQQQQQQRQQQLLMTPMVVHAAWQAVLQSGKVVRCMCVCRRGGLQAWRETETRPSR